MQTEKQRVIDDPQNWVYAYGYDEQGFYSGMIRRQPHPFREGEFLMPGSATMQRPNFVEGYRPRWNGSVWELIPRDSAKTREVLMQDAIDETRQRVFQDIVRSTTDVVRAELQKEMLDLKNGALTSLHDLKSEITREITQLMNDLDDKSAKKMSDVLSAIQNLTNDTLSTIQTSNERATAKYMEIKTDLENVHARASDEVTNLETLLTVEQKPGLIARIQNLFSSKSEAPVLPAPEIDEEKLKDL